MAITGTPRSLRAPDPMAEWDRDAEGQAEATVVNVSPFVARFEIAGTPGSRARKVKLEPGRGASIPGGYTREFLGSGRQPVRPTVEALTEREVYPKGPRLPMCVHEDKAHDMRAQWQAAIDAAREAPEPVKVSIPSADGGEPVEALIRPPSIAPSAKAVEVLARDMPDLEDTEDQAGGELDEPPPDHNDPLPVAEAAPKGRRGR